MAGGFFADTSGLDAQNVYGGTTNNAAADFDRLSAESPSAFGGKDKKQRQQQALQQSVAPPITPTPVNPTASPAPSAPPANSSGPGLVKSVLMQIKNPPQYNAAGAALVPGTPFTPQEFTARLVQELQPPPQMNALAPPPQAMQMPPPQQQAGMPMMAPYQGVPQFGPMAEGPPRREQQSPFGNQTFGGNTFGGNRFGGNTFGGNQFGASAPNIPTPQQPGPQSQPDGVTRLQMLLRQRNQPQQTLMPGQGYYRGGALKLMRGGYPDLMPLPEPPGVPVREPYAGGNYVEPDGQGDGRSDHVDAKLSPGEYVIDAETVAMLGNGDNDAGARALDTMRENVRKHKGKQLVRGKFSPDAKPATGYFSKGVK